MYTRTRTISSRLLGMALALVVPLGCADSSLPTGVSGPVGRGAASGPTEAEAIEFVALVNQHRVSIGVPPLIWHDGVAAVATAHCQDMIDRGYFSHTTPDGVTPWDRLAAAGITYSAAGENIAYGYATGSAVLAAWLGSSGHRANIESTSFTHHGVGLVGTYWTHVFIRPTTSPTAPPRAAERP